MFEFIRPLAKRLDLCVDLPAHKVLDLEIPHSYAAFIALFGYCRFGGLLLLHAPRTGHPDDLSIRASELRQMLIASVDADIAELGPDGSPELLARLVPFGISENGHTFAWDPDSLVDSEPEIVAVGAKVLSVHRTGCRFVDFLRALATAKAPFGTGSKPLGTHGRTRRRCLHRVTPFTVNPFPPTPNLDQNAAAFHLSEPESPMK